MNRGDGGGQRGARRSSRGGGSHSSRASSNSSGSSSSHSKTNRAKSKGGSNGQHKLHRSILKSEAAHCQESKYRLLGLPKTYWTKEVYQAMSSYGSVFRIEMEMSRSDSSYNAYVVFR